MLRIIGVVIDGGHRTQLVEALDEHSLRVEIREAQRTDDFCHSLLLGIVLYSLEQSAAHLDVIHKVDPTEANALSLPTLIGLMIDDCCYTTHHLSLLVSQEILSLAEVEGGIFLLVQHEHIVAEQVGRIILVTFVEVVVELHECLQISSCLNSFYFYRCHFLDNLISFGKDTNFL